ncbi:MAG: D-aminoacylase [Pseudomonadota bacterium]
MKFLTQLMLCIGLSSCIVYVNESSDAPAERPRPVVTRPAFDVLIRGGTVYDGSGAPGQIADVGVIEDRVAALGDLSSATADLTVDATGHAVSPGFINILSWAPEALLVDGRSMSDIKQGVTLEVFGEGWSYGPFNDTMKQQAVAGQGDFKYDIDWTSFGEFLSSLERRGVSANIASFVGATTVRVHELGYEDRPPTASELERMVSLVKEAMEEGALGVGSSLIYAPAFFAETEELIALVTAAGEYGGGYITHMRSEGTGFLEGIEETITIAEEADTWAQIYHFKPGGEANWGKHGAGIALLEAARSKGLDITANMYTYTAGSTGLSAAMPPWVQEGGISAWIKRLKDPSIRSQLIEEMQGPGDGWENLYYDAGGPENVLLVGFKNEALKPLTGKTVADVAAERGVSAEEVMMDLVIEDGSRVQAVYFLMSEENVRKNVAWPHMMFGSDGSSVAAEGPALLSQPHPRTYGNFARLLGKYVREEKIIPLEEAIHRLTGLSAKQLRIEDRGCLNVSCYADIVVFDPDTIIDRSTYADPHQYAEGVRDVFVNGIGVLRDTEHTGATPGRIVYGPGKRHNLEAEAEPS